MRKQLRKKLILIFKVALVMCFILGITISVEAATPRMTALKKGIVYKNYDITGDKKKDRIQITNSIYYGTRVLVNGSTMFRRTYNEYFEKAYIVTLKNGKTFLYLQVNYGGDYSSCSFLLQYKGGRLQNVLNPSADIWHEQGSKWWFTLRKVSGNSVVLTIANRNPSMSWVSANVTYQFKSNRFQLKTRTVNISYSPKKYLKVQRDLQLYKSSTSKNKSGILKKGKKGKVTKAYLGKTNIRFYVVGNNGKKGWFNTLKKAKYSGSWRVIRDFAGLAEAS